MLVKKIKDKHVSVAVLMIIIAASSAVMAVSTGVNSQGGVLTPCDQFFPTRFTSDQDGDDITDWYDCTRSNYDPTAANDPGRPIPERANGKQQYCIIDANSLSLLMWENARLILAWPDQVVGGSVIGATSDFGNPVFTIDNSYCIGQTPVSGGGPAPPPPPEITCSPSELIVPPIGSFTVEYRNAPSGTELRYSGVSKSVSGSGTETATFSSTSNRQTIQFILVDSTGAQVATANCDLANAPSGPGTPNPTPPSGTAYCTGPGQYGFNVTTSGGWWFYLAGSQIATGSGPQTLTFSGADGWGWELVSTDGQSISGSLPSGGSCTPPPPPPQDQCPSFPGFQDSSAACVEITCEQLTSQDGNITLNILWESLPNHEYEGFTDTFHRGRYDYEARWNDGELYSWGNNKGYTPIDEVWGLEYNNRYQSTDSRPSESSLASSVFYAQRRDYAARNQVWPSESSSNAINFSYSDFGLSKSKTRQVAEYHVVIVPKDGDPFLFSDLGWVSEERLRALQQLWPTYTDFWGFPAQAVTVDPVRINETRVVTETASRRFNRIGVWIPGTGVWGLTGAGVPYTVGKGIRILYRSTDGTERGAFDYAVKSDGQTFIKKVGNAFYQGEPVENLAHAGSSTPWWNVDAQTGRIVTYEGEAVLTGLTAGKRYEFDVQYMDGGGRGNTSSLQDGDLVRLASYRNPTHEVTDNAQDCGFTPPREGELSCTNITENQISVDLRWAGTRGIYTQYRPADNTSAPWQPHQSHGVEQNSNWDSFNSYPAISSLESATRYVIEMRELITNDELDTIECTTLPQPYQTDVPAPSPVGFFGSITPGQELQVDHLVTNLGPGAAPLELITVHAEVRNDSGSILSDLVGQVEDTNGTRTDTSDDFIRNLTSNDFSDPLIPAESSSPENPWSQRMLYTVPASVSLGNSICFYTIAHPGGNAANTALTEGAGFEDGSNPGRPLRGDDRCFSIAVRPYLEVSGGDVWAGTELTSTGDCTNEYIDAFIQTDSVNNTLTTPNARTGAFTEQAAMALGSIVGFGSAATAYPEDLLTFTNNDSLRNGYYTTTPKCVRNYYEALASYDNDLTYDNGSAISAIINLGDDTQYFVDQDKTLTGSNNLTYEGNSTIVVNGDVTITGNLRMRRDNIGQGFDLNIPSRVIVASGDINIASTVREVDAILIANGDINTCTAQDGTSPIQLAAADSDLPGTSSQRRCNRQLVINGQVMANQINFQRTRSSTTDPSPEPAEIINYSPETILGDHVLRSDQFVPAILKTLQTQDLPPVF